ncbi:hypothetical protein GW765_03730 [Candidatus Parcubacteria bacterium]|nr:hypothetical protein [Candidatus Parcubacteria bacterium]
MKWYIASRIKHKDLVKKTISDLIKSGEEISYDWTKIGSLKPYRENSKESSIIAKEVSEAMKDTDIFVLISDEAGTDMFVELGIAIGCWLTRKDMRIYVVGECNDRSLMHFHPSISRVDNLNDVFKNENINI